MFRIMGVVMLSVPPLHAVSPAALAPRRTPDVLSRLSDTKRHLLRGISRIPKARSFLDLSAFCGRSPPE
jgi:hypothetical protein